MSAITMFPALLGALLVALALSGQGHSAPVLDLKNPDVVQRLREMFDKDQTQAINDFYEQQALSAMTNPISSHPNGPVTRLVPISFVNLDAGKNASQQPSWKYVVVAPKENEDKDDTTGQSIAINSNGTHEAHLKSDARQSSLFGAFPSTGFGNGGLGSSNPFNSGVGGLMRPPSLSMPSMAPFRPFGPQTTRAPKTAIIGNGGGAMAMTNDNVVVVNVLSGNY